jgi:hypothetical protein
MSQYREITVTNSSEARIGRAGYIFWPKTPRTVSVTATGLNEIKGCAALNIMIADNGIYCPVEGCNRAGKAFKNKGLLSSHIKMQHPDYYEDHRKEALK